MLFRYNNDYNKMTFNCNLYYSLYNCFNFIIYKIQYSAICKMNFVNAENVNIILQKYNIVNVILYKKKKKKKWKLSQELIVLFIQRN